MIKIELRPCIQKKKNVDPLFKVGVSEMPVRPTHDDMATGHAISGAGLPIPLGVDTIVTIYPETSSTIIIIIVELLLAYVGVSIYLVGFLW